MKVCNSEPTTLARCSLTFARWILLLLLTGPVRWALGAEPASTNEQRTVLLVVGLPGEEKFAEAFNSWAAHWRKAAEAGKAGFVSVGLPATGAPEVEESAERKEPPGPDTDYSKLRKHLEVEPKDGAGELWITFIGHGTFNGREAKFNLRGPDVTASELSEWLKPFQRPVILLNTASASSPFMKALAGENRLVITSTRSGSEQNYTRFGQFVSEIISDTVGDLDKDGQTSVLEAFIFASKQTLDFYKSEGRLATEHALLDDNGDGLGTPGGDWFRGVRAVKKPAQGTEVDGLRANQFHLVRSAQEQSLSPETRARRDELERSINQLRDQKANMEEVAYYASLEKILLELAAIYGVEAEATKPASPAAPAVQ